MLQIITLPAGQDNYIWLIKKADQAVVIDPGSAEPVLERLRALDLKLHAILLTHHHHDHVAGVPALLAHYPEASCYGPAMLASMITNLTPLHDGAQLPLPAMDLTFDILHLPGHTQEHIAFYGQGALFCGDVLFAGGCGRLLGGTAEQMFDSLQRIKQLPPETLIYCAHEYTANNLAFGLLIEPDNPHLLRRIQMVARLRQQGLPTLPCTLSEELATNVFLRTHLPGIKSSAERIAMAMCKNEIQVFASLREKKNNV